MKVGDTIQVYHRIMENGKTRAQVFEGILMHIKGRGENKMFMVKKSIKEFFVERIWPLKSPNVEKIVVKSSPAKRVRRSVLH